MVAVFVHWDDVIQMASRNKSLFTCRERRSVWLNGPFNIYHDQTACFYNRYLAQEMDESFILEAKVGDNTIHQF